MDIENENKRLNQSAEKRIIGLSFDENLDIEARTVYRTGRVDKFTIEKIVPCIRKESKETIRAIIRIK